jgi:hydrogenase maturation protease
MPRVHIVCFGNLLAGDDGFGLHVHRALAHALPAHDNLELALFDGGLMGFAALTYFEECELVIAVDALAFSAEEGRIQRLLLTELSAPREAFSAHALDLVHLFHVLPIVFEGRLAPEVVIIGAEIHPPRGDFSMELSPAVAAAIPRAVSAIVRELDAWSLRARRPLSPLADREEGSCSLS